MNPAEQMYYWLTVYPVQTILWCIVFVFINYALAVVASRIAWRVIYWFLLLTLLPGLGHIIMIVVIGFLDIRYYRHQRKNKATRDTGTREDWFKIDELTLDETISVPPFEEDKVPDKIYETNKLLPQGWREFDTELSLLIEYKQWDRAVVEVHRKLEKALKLREKSHVDYYERMKNFLNLVKRHDLEHIDF